MTAGGGSRGNENEHFTRIVERRIEGWVMRLNMKQRAPAAMPGSGFLGWLLLGLLAILLSGMAAHSGGAVVRLRSGALASHRAGDADRLRIVVAKDGRAAGVARR